MGNNFGLRTAESCDLGFYEWKAVATDCVNFLRWHVICSGVLEKWGTPFPTFWWKGTRSPTHPDFNEVLERIFFPELEISILESRCADRKFWKIHRFSGIGFLDIFRSMNIYRIDLALIHVRIELACYVKLEIPKILIFYFLGCLYLSPVLFYTICKSTRLFLVPGHIYDITFLVLPV